MERSQSELNNNSGPLIRSKGYHQLPGLIGLNKGNIFPDQLVSNAVGESQLLSNLNAGKKVIRCILNLSDPAQWAGEIGKAELAVWVAQQGAAGCTARAAEIIKRCQEYTEAGYQIEIVAANISPDKLEILRSVQTDRYRQFYLEKCKTKLPENFVLPVTFVALTPQARQKLWEENSYPTFEYKTEKYLYAQTFVLDENKNITNVLKHGHVDVKTFDAKNEENVCALEAKEILAAVKPGSSLNSSNKL